MIRRQNKADDIVKCKRMVKFFEEADLGFDVDIPPMEADLLVLSPGFVSLVLQH